jgi:hypothetical protein
MAELLDGEWAQENVLLFSRAFIPPWSLALVDEAGMLSDQTRRFVSGAGTLAFLDRTNCL